MFSHSSRRPKTFDRYCKYRIIYRKIAPTEKYWPCSSSQSTNFYTCGRLHSLRIWLSLGQCSWRDCLYHSITMAGAGNLGFLTWKGTRRFKKPKDHIAHMACANATGSIKLPLVFIHKSLNPRSFKNVNETDLPVQYYAQNNSVMDSSIFKTWFHDKFVPQWTGSERST